ncbi:hypothetical protein Scep_007852 [Stephania cephalantha]|uniref:Uncharacterized protein n=1 Tax=Stephania cephalantha TaxID=152367 RepID=A0AAP0PP57_9MAGN
MALLDRSLLDEGCESTNVDDAMEVKGSGGIQMKGSGGLKYDLVRQDEYMEMIGMKLKPESNTQSFSVGFYKPQTALRPPRTPVSDPSTPRHRATVH